MARPYKGPRNQGGNNGNGNNYNNRNGNGNGGYQNGGGRRGSNAGSRGNGRNQGNNNNGGNQNGRNHNNQTNNNRNNRNGNNNNRQQDGWQKRWGYTLYNLIVSGIESENSAELREVVSAAALALSSAVNKLERRGKTKAEIARELNIPWQACHRLYQLTGYLMEGFLDPGPDQDGDMPMSDNDSETGSVIYADVDNTDLEKLLFNAIVGHIRQ
jgi:hypothetical protein